MLRGMKRAPGLLLVAATQLLSQQLRWTDLSEPSHRLASSLGVSAVNFDRTRSAMDRRSAERLHEGEMDHLIFYMLQSRTFTHDESIEPAGSARHPEAVNRRIVAFLAAVQHPVDGRQRYFARLLKASDAEATVRTEYARAMAFLDRKEVECRKAASPQTCVAELYAERGLSSDTSPESLTAVREGLSWIRKNREGTKIARVLIVGPGVDFAPRTGFRDGAPQTYQPQGIADMLRTMGMAAEGLRVECADVNPRVVEAARESCDAAHELNIATARVAGAAYDLIVATNVLLYLNDAELLLAMTNIRGMLKPSGLFLHNDVRFAVKVFGKACGMEAIHFGDVVLDPARRSVLTDHFVVHGVSPPTL
jgi:hypothetical protein